jgi:hypothetical protein
MAQKVLSLSDRPSALPHHEMVLEMAAGDPLIVTRTL